MSPLVHGSSELLQRFASGELEGALRDAVIAELATCAECRAIVGALAARPASPRPEAALPPTYAAARSIEGFLPPGTKIGGRYRIESVLGEGGMGVVYRVVHELLGRRFALKMLHPTRAHHEGAVRRFLGEARALASLGHEGIVDVVDLGQDDDTRPFLVMELLEGETLEERLRREGRMSLEHAFDAALRIAQALAVAHTRGIVHRDIKPANVFVAREALRPGWVKLLDFGLAKLRADGEAGADPTLTRTGAVLGTPRYMAPEQWRADKDLDARADVFSWGVTVHRMLTGELPYRGHPELPLLPPSYAEGLDVRRTRPEVPLVLAELVEAALARDRTQRPEDGGVLAARWQSALTQFATRRPESVRPRASLLSILPDSARSSTIEAPVIGRTHELEQLMAKVVERSRPALLVGPEGVGKSALIGALVQKLEREGLPAIGATRVLRVDPSGPALGEAPFSSLASLSPHLSAPSLERGLRERLFGTLALDTVLVIGDPSALDPDSQRLLRELGGQVGAFVVGEARSATSAALIDAEVLALGGLSSSELTELVKSRGVVLTPSELVSLSELTGGHPLFVLQCLALRSERATSIDAIPAQLEDAIGARLQAAPPEAAHAWQVAAILRAPLSASDLLALGVTDAEPAIAWLESRGILQRGESREGTSALDRPLRFSAGLFADVGERSLSEDSRALLHRNAAALRVRQLGPESERGAWAQIARHHALGGELAHASDAYARAALGSRAVDLHPTSRSERGVPLERVSFALRARWAGEALGLAERARRERADAVELRLVGIEGLEGEGRYEEAIAAFDALEKGPWTADQEARAYVSRGSDLQRLGLHDEARHSFARAEKAARVAGSAETLARSLGRHAVCLALSGALEEARDRLLAAEELVLKEVPSVRADLAGWKAQVAGLSGDLGARRDAYWAAVELFRAEGNHRFAAYSLLNLGDTYARLGAYDEAERALASAYAECSLFGARVMAGYAALDWGYVLLCLDRPEEAARKMAEAHAIAHQGRGEQRLAAYAVLYRARAALLTAERAPRLEELRRLGEGELKDPTWRALTEATLARAALLDADAARALGHARAAERILEEAGALEEGEAEVALVLADALLASSDAAAAEAVVRRGAARVSATARKIAGAHWRACFTVDVRAHRELLERAAASRSG